MACDRGRPRGRDRTWRLQSEGINKFGRVPGGDSRVVDTRSASGASSGVRCPFLRAETKALPHLPGVCSVCVEFPHLQLPVRPNFRGRRELYHSIHLDTQPILSCSSSVSCAAKCHSLSFNVMDVGDVDVKESEALAALEFCLLLWLCCLWVFVLAVVCV